MLYRGALLLVCAVAACSFPHGSSSRDGGGTQNDDVLRIDVPENTIDARTCFGSGLVTICLTSTPAPDYTVSTASGFNTDADCTFTRPQEGGGPMLCVIAAQTIHINAPLQASGSLPLVLLATDTLEIASTGTVDVGSYRVLTGGGAFYEVIGAGQATSAALCGTPSVGGPDAGVVDGAGGGGGAGGSFVGKGGDGGSGRSGGGGAGGVASPAGGTPTFVRGGCAGSAGGSGMNNTAGAPGHGGGAAYLIAGTSITNAGSVRACGMGGYGGGLYSGGGGGGAGGLIGLDAPTVTNTGTINANSGGGGEGGGQNGVGDSGNSGVVVNVRAAGGSGNVNGGNGGQGTQGAILDGDVGLGGITGGGAGGGGAGMIGVYPAQALAGAVSPTP